MRQRIWERYETRIFPGSFFLIHQIKLLSLFLPADITLPVELNGSDFLNLSELEVKIIIPLPRAGTKTKTDEPTETKE